MEAFLNNLWASLSTFAVSYGFRILGALVLLLVGPIVIKFLIKLIKGGKKFSTLEANTQTLIVDIVKIVCYVFLVSLIAIALGAEGSAIAAAIASCGLVVGLALQGSLSNFAGGIMILVFKPFRIGDFVDTGSHSGTVKDIGIFYTVIDTPDNKVVTIPNGNLSNSAVTDYSMKETRRLDLEIAVSYDSDIDLVKQTLLDLAEAHELVLKDPAPFVRLGTQGDSALVFKFRVWVKNADYWTVNFDLLEASKKIFDKRGISIPYPQLDVHMKNDENN